MQYKLSKYEDVVCAGLKRYFSNSHELGVALDKYNRYTEYRNFEKSVIWSMWRMITRSDNFALYDKMREEVPDFKDVHIETLMRNAVKKNYGGSIPQLLQNYRNTYFTRI